MAAPLRRTALAVALTVTFLVLGGSNSGADPQADHWAFRPVRRPAVPVVADPRPSVVNPVDAFVLANLKEQKLSPNPEADRRTLIRRLKFDLLGLPPTPEEVDAFAADCAPDAYEKLVDRYLASPHFGERWARHWLDAVRFAESHGFEMNLPRPNAWPYRDWVIRSFNADTPYDRFVRDQLVGDATGADEATGFLVGGPWDQVKSPDPVLTANQRADELHDMVGTAGSAFLGLTVGCARCHDHKFDPIPQADYYRLAAVFAGVKHGERPLRGQGEGRGWERLAVRVALTKAEADLAALEPLADPRAKSPRRLPVNPRANTERFAPVEALAVRLVVLAANNHEPAIDEFEVYTAEPGPRNVALTSAGAKLRSGGDWPDAPALHRLEFLADGRYGNARSWIAREVGRGWVEVEFPAATEIDRVVWGRDREGKFVDRLATRYRIDVWTADYEWVTVASSDDRLPVGTPGPLAPPALDQADRAKWKGLTKRRDGLAERLAELERVPMVYAGRFTAPEPTFRLHRGDPTQKREPVGPGALTGVGRGFDIPADATDPQRRLAVAEWVTDPANPLTARVIVNRLWQHHFGTGIVDTPSDFGRNGARPTHPELLDWLASELVEKRWSLKHVHRLIVTSAAYRQSSGATPAGLTTDAQSRLLWRYPPRRLEAEAIRDAVLSVSGKLDPRAGGPGFDLFEPNTNYVKVYTPKAEFGPAEFRRMVYQTKPRMQPDDTFGAFDCPDAGQIAPRRNASTTPLQALNLLNAPFMLQQAAYFARRVETEAGAEHAARVRRVFRLAFQRDPSDKELTAAAALVQTHGLPALCRAVLNANEFLYVD